MKFCTKCGNQVTDEMLFCQQCGAKITSIGDTSSSDKQKDDTQSYSISGNGEYNANAPKSRTGMIIWMIISLVFAGIFTIGSIADLSMLAGVCLFSILGVMFFVLAKAPKGSVKLFSGSKCFKKTNGISKGAFVGVSIFLAFFLFVGIINAFDIAEVSSNKETHQSASNEKADTQTTEKKDIPTEFAKECPISVSVSMYDNIIGFPELKCNVKNNTSKEIAAIQLYFIPKDVYGEEINSIFIQNKLQSDTPISASGTDTFIWQMVEQSVKSGDLYVYSVYFSDGTEWGDRNAPTSKIKKFAMHMNASY